MTSGKLTTSQSHFSPSVKWAFCTLRVVLSSGRLQFFSCRVFASGCFITHGCGIKPVVFISVLYWAPAGWHCPLHFTFIIAFTLDNTPPRLIMSSPFTSEDTEAQRPWVTGIWPQSWIWAMGCPTPKGSIVSPMPHCPIFSFPFFFFIPLGIETIYTLCSDSLKFQGLSNENCLLNLFCLMLGLIVYTS